jgi:hypothetical protein
MPSSAHSPWTAAILHRSPSNIASAAYLRTRGLHESLQHALAEDEVERRRLSKALLPQVRRFYAGYFDPETHLPHYGQSSRA